MNKSELIEKLAPLMVSDGWRGTPKETEVKFISSALQKRTVKEIKTELRFYKTHFS